MMLAVVKRVARALKSWNPLTLIVDDEDAFIAEVAHVWTHLYGEVA